MFKPGGFFGIVGIMEKVNFTKVLPVQGTYDVVVSGSGPAGICAAVSAARQGSKVCLIERYGSVGGNLSVGHVGPILGMVGEGTMRTEMVNLLNVPDNDMTGEVAIAHDMEKAKTVLANLINAEKNITVLLQTMVSDVVLEGNRIKGLVISGKEGLQVVEGKVVIDSTGDGDVSFFAGCEIQKGREDGLMQPVTLEYTVNNLDESKAITCIGDIDDVQFKGKRFLDWCKDCADNGEIPAAVAAVRLHKTVYPGHRQVNTTQLNKIDSTKTSDLFKAEVELRNQIDTVTDFLRTHLPGYENCEVISSGTTVGTRETRRVMGDYVLTREDILAGKRFDDVMVHKAIFFVDIHNPEGAGQAEKVIALPKPYDIPYRCFVPKKIEGLYTAGRCISGDHSAHASYRVMSICMAMGQAVGVAASLCVKEGVLPRQLDVKKVQTVLTGLGVDLFSE